MIFSNTTDGSPTILHPLYKEYLHSTHGSIQESNHIYIQHGYDLCQSKPSLNILEMGLGTGLNLFLSFVQSIKYGQKVKYIAAELYPIENKILEEFWEIILHHFPNYLPFKKEIFQILNSPWEKEVQLSPLFEFTKYKKDFLTLSSTQNFDLCYYDAFDPDSQPELWDLRAFQHLSSLIKKEGYAVTYCCKGDVKRNLKECGFDIKKIPGPIGKREFIVATKK